MKTKNLLIFCVSLNIALSAGIGLIFFLGRKEVARAENEKNEAERATLAESVDMLEKSGIAFAQGDYLSARLSLNMTVYALSGRNHTDEAGIIGMGDWYFFDNNDINENGAENNDEFFLFISASRSLLTEKELTPEENEIIDKIKIRYADHAFTQSIYPSLVSKAETTEKKAYDKALSVLGEKVVIEKCENSLFPLTFNYSGKNTFVSISVHGERIIKLYFYPGASEIDIDKENAVGIMENFIRREQIYDVSLTSFSEEGGIYYASFGHEKYPSATILVGVKGSGGRVCLFDAEEYYKNFKS